MPLLALRLLQTVPQQSAVPLKWDRVLLSRLRKPLGSALCVAVRGGGTNSTSLGSTDGTCSHVVGTFELSLCSYASIWMHGTHFPVAAHFYAGDYPWAA